MKNILFSLLFILSTTFLFAQEGNDSSKYSIKVGIGPNFKANPNYTFYTKNLGINFGSEINYHKGKHFSFGLGLYYFELTEKYHIGHFILPDTTDYEINT